MTVSALAILAYVSTTCSLEPRRLERRLVQLGRASKSAANAAECLPLAGLIAHRGSRKYFEIISDKKKRVMQTHAQ